MRDVVILFVHLIVIVVRMAGPGGLRSVVGESVLVKRLCCENSRKKMSVRFARRSALFSGSDSEQIAREPRLAGPIFLYYPPDSALSESY